MGEPRARSGRVAAASVAGAGGEQSALAVAHDGPLDVGEPTVVADRDHLDGCVADVDLMDDPEPGYRTASGAWRLTL
jgi:hypothetical protein